MAAFADPWLIPPPAPPAGPVALGIEGRAATEAVAAESPAYFGSADPRRHAAAGALLDLVNAGNPERCAVRIGLLVQAYARTDTHWLALHPPTTVDETISRLTANVAARADEVFVSLLFRTALSAANAALATIARGGLPPADVLSYAEARTLSESALPTDIGPSAEDR